MQAFEDSVATYQYIRELLNKNLSEYFSNSVDFVVTLNHYAYLASLRMLKNRDNCEDIIEEYTYLAIRDAKKGRLIEKREFAIIANLLNRCKGLVLDLGAGWGRFKRLLDDLKLDVVYLEPSLLGNWILESLGASKTICAYGERLPFYSKSFEAVMISQVLHHSLPDVNPDTIINETARILKPGGTLLCMESSGTKFTQKYLENLLTDNNFKIKHLVQTNRQLSLKENQSSKILIEACLNF